MDDVYSAMGFPSIYETYSYYGVRNMILPPQIPIVNAILGNGEMSLNWEPSFYDGKPTRAGFRVSFNELDGFNRVWIANMRISFFLGDSLDFMAVRA